MDTNLALVIAGKKAKRILSELTDRALHEAAVTTSRMNKHGMLQSSKCLSNLGQVAERTAKELVAKLIAVHVETVGVDLPRDDTEAAIKKEVDEFYSAFKSRYEPWFKTLPAWWALPILGKLDENIAALKSTIPEGLDIALYDARRHAGFARRASMPDATESTARSLGDFRNDHSDPSRAGSLPATPATDCEPPAAEPPKHLFHKAGSYWDVIFESGEPFHLKDTLGTKYIDYLLHHPNKVISAYNLEIAIQPEKADARPKNSIQDDSDPRAVCEYLRELDSLRSEREKAKADANQSEVERLDKEIEPIEAALKQRGQSPDAGERARGNVRKAIAAVRQNLLKGDKNQKAFGEHIRLFVSTGHECSYNQPQPGRIWG